jgi:uncharacterized protein HemY
MAIASTNSATPTLQSVLNRARLEQAKREAQNAEDKVESLQQQTERAEQDRKVRDDRVQALSARNALEDSTYVSQLRASRSAVAPATQDFLIRMYSATSAKFAAGGNALKASLTARPFVNTLGQPTGRIVDLAA